MENSEKKYESALAFSNAIKPSLDFLDKNKIIVPKYELDISCDIPLKDAMDLTEEIVSGICQRALKQFQSIRANGCISYDYISRYHDDVNHIDVKRSANIADIVMDLAHESVHAVRRWIHGIPPLAGRGHRPDEELASITMDSLVKKALQKLGYDVRGFNEYIFGNNGLLNRRDGGTEECSELPGLNPYDVGKCMFPSTSASIAEGRMKMTDIYDINFENTHKKFAKFNITGTRVLKDFTQYIHSESLLAK